MASGSAGRRVRQGATRIEIENTGDVVFLYDAANADAIRAAAPGWAAADAPYDAEAEVFGRLAREGLLVAYEPAGGDAVEVEVAVGPDLTAAERAGGTWLRPQAARLALPSGRLRIETFDSLGLTAEPPTEPGGVVEVPPGEYTLALHRVDQAAMGAAAAGWPDEVLVLTPGAPEGLEPAALLRYPVARPRWGAWKVQGDVATGEITWALVGCGTNLDAGAVARLGLRPGQRLEARLGPQTHRAVFLGALDQQAYRELIGPADLDAAAAREPDLARAYMYPNPGPDGEVIPALAFHDFTGGPRPWSQLAIGMPVAVRVLPDPVFAAPDDAWASMWQVRDGALRTEVLGCGAADLILGATAEALAALGAKAGDELVLEVGGETRRVRLLKDQRGATEPGDALVAWPMPHWELGGTRVLRVRSARGGEEARLGIAAAVGSPAVLRK